MSTEVASRASFAGIRYAQCWEDADVLLAALDVQPGDVCVSIASAGDNTLALLTRNPQHAFAIDLSPAQLACLELRIAAYRELEHAELLELIGSRPSKRREQFYRRCRAALSSSARAFWDGRPKDIAHGIGAAGKFERYFALFRQRVLPLVHSRDDIARLLRGGTPSECAAYFDRCWDNWRWRLLFRVFFSRFLMGRLGRDPSFFTYVEGSIADRLLARTRHLNPAEIILSRLAGRPRALALALRPNIGRIRANVDRIEWYCMSLEISQDAGERHCFQPDDIFKYMSPENISFELAVGLPVADWRTASAAKPARMLAAVSLPDLRNIARGDKAFFKGANEEIVWS